LLKAHSFLTSSELKVVGKPTYVFARQHGADFFLQELHNFFYIHTFWY